MALFDFLRRKAVTPGEAKASAFGSMVSAQMLGRPVWPQRNFQQFAKEGYQQNAIVYACISLTATAAAAVPLDVMQRNAKGEESEANVPELVDLLDNPQRSPEEDGLSFRRAVFSDFMLSGNAFMERVDGMGGMPWELHRLRPDRVKVIAGPDGRAAAYEYAVNGMTKRIDIDRRRGKFPVLHLRDYHPTDDWYGMSALDPAAYAIDSHTAAAAWNTALLNNAARPSGALVYAPKEGPASLSSEQFNRLKEMLETGYTGAGKTGRPMLLDGGLDWKEMGFNPKEMDFIDGMNASARHIALNLGVPPMILSIPGDNTYSNYQEAQKAWYRQTVLPLVEMFCRRMSRWVAPDFGKGLYIVPDLDDLPVFSDERESVWKRLETADFITPNEKREAVGFDSVEGGDTVLVPSSMIPLDAAGASMTGDGTVPPDAEAEADDIDVTGATEGEDA